MWETPEVGSVRVRENMQVIDILLVKGKRYSSAFINLTGLIIERIVRTQVVLYGLRVAGLVKYPADVSDNV